ncbi:MAG: TonB-dependent receptor [Bryobacter sp.]|nr:TonB-dependent receptor [Bryobacter sp.]
MLQTRVLRSAGLFVLTVVPLCGQSPLGTITGTVSDGTGSRVPGVEVTATQVNTNLTFKAKSSEDGTYVVPNLPVGPYTLTAVAQGFKTFKRSDLVLEVSQRLRVDVTLELGALTESVTVSGEPPRVQTEESALGTSVERQRIEQLPMNGRNVFSLARLVAGVQPRNYNDQGFADAGNQGFSQIRFNGGPVYGNQIFLDGGANTAPVHGEVSVVPMADAVEEFRVETNALKAEHGQNNGGVINVVSKAGTNQYHGTLYHFFRNDALDARNAFVTQPDNAGRLKPVLRYNQFGGTLGGPVQIPKVYDGKNRTFFFFGYEQYRYRNAAIRRGTVPTPAERNGDFSNTRDGSGTLIPIYDPNTTRANPAGSGFVRDLMPGNVLPRARLDALALRVQEYMPLPNQTPNNAFTNSQNFLSLATSGLTQSTTSIRLDHRFSDRDAVFGRYSITKNTRDGQGWGMGVADSDTFARQDQRDNWNGIVTWTRTVSSSLINEMKGNVTRQNLIFVHPSFGGNWPEKLGFPSIIPQTMFPGVSVAGMVTVGKTDQTSASGVRAQHTVQFADSLSWVRGKHQIKMGVDQRWVRLNWVSYGRPSGWFDFSAGLTGDPQRPAGTGFGQASYLLGEVGGGELRVRPFFSFHSWNTGAYVQDDYKITPRFTLNLGMRYDIASAPVERWDRHSNFDPFIANSVTGMMGALTYAGSTAPRSFVDRDNNNISPRFGFAYDVTGDGKTAVRGGYGMIFMYTDSGDTNGDNSNALGHEAITPFVAPTGGPFKAFQFSVGPPQILQPDGAKGGPAAYRGQGMRYQDRNAPTPYLQQWNLTLQRELLRGWVGSVSYAGNKGTKLFGGNYNLNQLDPAYWSQGLALQDQVPNPFFGQISSGAVAGRTVPRSQLLQPYPDYGSISMMNAHGASSIYHSIQATVEKRFSQGLSMLVSYTGGKLINDSFSEAGANGGGGDFRIGRFNRRLDRALDTDDVSRRLVISGVYELPFGKGKKFGANVNEALNQIIGGWQINTMTTYQTGLPLQVRGANNFTGINWPNVVGDPYLGSGERSVDRWFNTSVFQNPADWTLGNVPRTLPNVRGPGIFDIAFSIFKTFRIKERMRLDFRTEMFNAINWVNYNNPNVSFSPNRQGVNTNPNFGRILGAGEARRIQLGLRLEF